MVKNEKNITKLRISAHKLKIETDRFNNKHKYIPPELRLCTNCNANKTEDEFHFLLECSKDTSYRDEWFRKCSLDNTYVDDYNNHDSYG